MDDSEHFRPESPRHWPTRGWRKRFSLRAFLGLWTVIILAVGVVSQQWHTTQLRKALVSKLVTLEDVGCVRFETVVRGKEFDLGNAYDEYDLFEHVMEPNYFISLPNHLHLGIAILFPDRKYYEPPLPSPPDLTLGEPGKTIHTRLPGRVGDTASFFAVPQPNQILKDAYLLPSLELVSLSYSGSDNQSLRYLTPLGRLKWLDISHTNIDDSGVPILARMTQLGYLDARETKITAPPEFKN